MLSPPPPILSLVEEGNKVEPNAILFDQSELVEALGLAELSMDMEDQHANGQLYNLEDQPDSMILDPSTSQVRYDVGIAKETLKKASADVIVQSTRQEYTR